MDVYIDELLLVNFLADLAILRATSVASRERTRFRRLAAGAAAGAVYGVGKAFPALAFLYGFAGRTAAAGIITLAAFGADSLRVFLRRLLAFGVVSFAFGGGVYALSLLTGGSPSFRRETLFLAAVTAASEAMFRRFPATKRGRNEIQARATLLGRSVAFTASEDTGASIRDPLTGRGAVVISPASARGLLPKRCAELVAEGRGAEDVIAAAPPELAPKLGVLPCGTVSERALLLTLRPDSLTLGGKESDALLAVSRGEIFSNGCRAVVGSDSI